MPMGFGCKQIGSTPIDFAEEKGHAELLIDKGANIHEKDNVNRE